MLPVRCRRVVLQIVHKYVLNYQCFIFGLQPLKYICDTLEQSQRMCPANAPPHDAEIVFLFIRSLSLWKRKRGRLKRETKHTHIKGLVFGVTTQHKRPNRAIYVYLMSCSIHDKLIYAGLGRRCRLQRHI